MRCVYLMAWQRLEFGQLTAQSHCRWGKYLCTGRAGKWPEETEGSRQSPTKWESDQARRSSWQAGRGRANQTHSGLFAQKPFGWPIKSVNALAIHCRVARPLVRLSPAQLSALIPFDTIRLAGHGRRDLCC